MGVQRRMHRFAYLIIQMIYAITYDLFMLISHSVFVSHHQHQS